MLLKLTIKNFAIIRQMVFEPSANLNIITGETGAGKSIILDALALILGSRADTTIKTVKGEKCVVEGVFKLDEKKYLPLFVSMGLDYDQETIIRREINDAGKSRSFINDTPVNLSQLKTIANSLVSIHSQNENSMLSEKAYQFELLDNFNDNGTVLDAYRTQLKKYKSDCSELVKLEQQHQALLKEKDYLQYLVDEFEKAALQPGEESLLEEELNLLSSAEQIGETVDFTTNNLTEGERTLIDELAEIRQRLRGISQTGPTAAELLARIESVILELKEISRDAMALKESAQPDSQRLEEVNSRIALIQNLKRKHTADTIDTLLAEYDAIADKLLNMANIDSRIEDLKNSVNTDLKTLKATADKIHAARLKIIPNIEKEIKGLLSRLEMPKADIRFELTAKDEPDEFGTSDLNILFTANPGMPLQTLSKVASGGELSRLALCFRSIEAKRSDMATMIFDEIDTGVSGKVADTIGALYEKLAADHQLIAITHLPQVAGYGHTHFMIGKQEENGITNSYLRKLNPDERVHELAKMLSGNEATDVARQNALELLKN